MFESILPKPCISNSAACALILTLFALPQQSPAASDGQRWYQVEVSIFTNENPMGQGTDQQAEFWSPERINLQFPERMRQLDSMRDILLIEEPEAPEPVFSRGLPTVESAEPDEFAEQAESESRTTVGPPLYEPGAFRFPNYATDAFLLLPPEQHDFVQTNRALTRSPAHRLLFHGAWRQPIVSTARATAVQIADGRELNGRHELEGSLRFRFNRNEDRVVIDANLWLTDFRTIDDSEQDWILPPLPQTDDQTEDPPQRPGLTIEESPLERGRERARTGPGDAVEIEDESQIYYIRRIVQLAQSRDMRSNEFHYLDHPALGVLVEVKPYIVPEPLLQPLDEEPLANESL